MSAELGFVPRSGGPYFGFPVVEYDGTNAEQIVEALDLDEGDVVIAMPDRPMLMKRPAFEEMLRMERP